ncbi:MAG: dethiobiotin synthase [Limnohabitans sp.]|nr:dethiobiotin synthase [Limnohabitans sp.]
MKQLFPSQAFSCFVTGTDTEIGKTLVASALVHMQVIRGWRVAAMKPVAAGAEWRDNRWCNEDAEALAACVSVKLPQEITTPYLFKTPAAPHIAASLEEVVIDRMHLISCYQQVRAQADAVVVEGVGGFRVPLNDNYDTADMAKDLGLPVVLVVGMRLGCISQALLTAEAISTRGLSLMGWVANTVDPHMLFPQENIDAIAQRINAPLLGCIPRLLVANAATAAACLI